MKRKVTMTGIKKMSQIRAIIKNNYPDYTIDHKLNFKIASGHKRMSHIYLQYKNDGFNSILIAFDPNEDSIEIRKMNGNKYRRYQELYKAI